MLLTYLNPKLELGESKVETDSLGRRETRRGGC